MARLLWYFVIISLSLTGCSKSTEDADIGRRVLARHDVAYFGQRAREYKEQNGSFPETLAPLVPELKGNEGIHRLAVPLDPWGYPYVYVLNEDGESFSVASYGSDRSPGGTGASADIYYDGSAVIAECDGDFDILACSYVATQD